MNDTIRILERKIVWKKFIRVEELVVEQDLPDGRTIRLDREVHDHGAAAAILLYDPARSVVVLVRQFRTGAHMAGGPSYLLEIPAGLLDGDAPAEAISREAMEETGYFVGEARHLFDFFASPGTLTEKVALFVAFVSTTDRVSEGGGLEDEHEFIEVVELPLYEAFKMIESGGIIDAKTIMALQWAMLNRQTLEEAHLPA